MKAHNADLRHRSSGLKPADHLLSFSYISRFSCLPCVRCERRKAGLKGQQLCACPSYTSQLSESDNVRLSCLSKGSPEKLIREIYWDHMLTGTPRVPLVTPESM